MIRHVLTTSAALAVVLTVISGPASAQEVIAQAELAMVPSQHLRLELTGACTDLGAVIHISNRGSKWPRTGEVKLYHNGSDTQIASRRLRLAPGQHVAFKVDSKVLGGRAVTLWVDPHWYPRPYQVDASLDCGGA